MKGRGMFRYLAVSGHNRPLFPQLAKEGVFDIFHVRYNAVHRGAEVDIFEKLPGEGRPGIVAYTATRWGDLLKELRMPPGDIPLSGADCYRFVLSHPAVDVCMSGPADMAQMAEALKALEKGPMSEGEMARARRIGDHIHTHHKRWMG
jgi:predicted aldo/keto reductase-like oxidoreductase